MSNAIGWIMLHRQIQDHWIWKDANKFKWWVDILLTVNNKKNKVAIGNEVFECDRGQSLLSIQSWGQRWGVSKDTARNFFSLLEKDKMIYRVSIGKSTRITVCNYDSYQTPLPVKKPTAVRTHDTNNNDNNNLSILESRRLKESEFKKTLTPFIKTDKNPNGKYSLEMAISFFNHWSEWSDEKNKMNWELKDTWEVGKRLATWAKKEQEFNPKQQKTFNQDFSNVGN